MQKTISEVEFIIKEVKNYLRPSDKKEIAEEIGVSRDRIAQVLTGKPMGEKSFAILMRLHERALKNRDDIQKTAQRWK